MMFNISDRACVPFSNLLANVFKKRKSLKKNHECGVTGVFCVVE